MTLICGIDEAGRGPLCGPVFASAVILDSTVIINDLKDSKKLSEKNRNNLYEIIKSMAIESTYAIASVEEIDKLNILQASLLAMKRAILNLTVKPDKVLVDGTHKPNIELPVQTIIGGDSLIAEISAASIIAKVYRDNLMKEIDSNYPNYGFAKHKGYGTKFHLEAIKLHGPCSIHRKTFKGVI